MGNFISSEHEKFPLTIRKIQKFGYIPDIPDQRDIWATFPSSVKCPTQVDLRKLELLPKIFDQETLGSCAAHAILAAYSFDLNKKSLDKDFIPSRQFIYFNQRFIAGTSHCDSGASPRDGLKVLNRLGVCSEEFFPYNPQFFTDKPQLQAYKNALEHKKIIQYRRIRLVLNDIHKALSMKIPVIMGMTWYESFNHPDVTRTGILNNPKLSDKIVGSQVVLIVGYDSQRKFLLCRNSWGSEWGQAGYFWISQAFINSRNCGDLWILSTGLKESAPSDPLPLPPVIKIEKVPAAPVPEFKKSDSDSESDKELSDNEGNLAV